MSTVYLFALANLAVCGVIAFIALCRLNSMQNTVLLRVRAEYACYMGGAIASGLQPLWGEWPEYGTIALAGAMLFGLFMSGSAWKGDKPPASATAPAPLE